MTKESIDELLQGGQADGGDPPRTLLRLALQYIVEEALEGKTRDLARLLRARRGVL